MGGKTFALYLVAIVIGAATVIFCVHTLCELASEPEIVVSRGVGDCSFGEVLLPNLGTIREFPSVDELQNWLRADDLDSYKYQEITFDCDDFAFELQRRALSDGYYMSIEVMEGSVYGDYHVTNVTKIENVLYTVNAETDEVAKLCRLD